MSDLHVTVDGRDLAAEWTGDNPRTRAALVDTLPLSGDGTRWGAELYFPVNVDVPPEDAVTDVPVGALAYWPRGNALCLFWGATPASEGEAPRAASPVNVVARVRDVERLTGLTGGATVRIEQA
jgi:hypothetical protein